MKKLICWTSLLLIIATLIPSCNLKEEHVHAFGEWTVTKEATCQTPGEKIRVCDCTATETEIIEPSHTPEIHDAVTASCTKWSASGIVTCSVCHEVLQDQEFIGPKSHDYVNNVCTVCNKTQTDYTDISLYAANEGYEYFKIAQNGDAMRSLYDEMEKVLSTFHTGIGNAEFYVNDKTLGNLYKVCVFDYVKHGLSLEEAQIVYTIFRKDHPVFYWLSYMLYHNNQTITITTVAEFADRLDRINCNKLLYKGIEEYSMLAGGETDAYDIALIFYNAILENNTYAYNSEQKPDDAQWAHSIIGDFLYGKFVCEGYANLFQLLLNLHNVENRFVVGKANGNHCWNLVRMDNGEWYWFDLTWGDDQEDPYKYFCSTDKNFKTHTPIPSNEIGHGLYFNGTLPKRGTSAYSSDKTVEIGEVITVDGCEYTLVAYATVKSKNNDAKNVSHIIYLGEVYTVVK